MFRAGSDPRGRSRELRAGSGFFSLAKSLSFIANNIHRFNAVPAVAFKLIDLDVNLQNHTLSVAHNDSRKGSVIPKVLRKFFHAARSRDRHDNCRGNGIYELLVCMYVCMYVCMLAN